MAEDAITENLMEKMKILIQKPGDNADPLRSLTAKLHSRTTSQDPITRQSTLDKMWKGNSSFLLMMTSLLEISRDIGTSNNLAGIIREAICLKPGKALRKAVNKKSSAEINADPDQENALKSSSLSKVFISPAVELGPKEIAAKKANNAARQLAITHMVRHNATATIARVILHINSKKEPNNGNLELLLYDLLWILSQLSQKDTKFSVKIRILSGVKTMHGLLKIHFTNTKVLFPLLNIMKQLSKNPTTSAILVRDGIVSTYEKVVLSLGYVPTARLRLCLDTVDYLSRNKVCCIQMVKTGVIHLVMRVFDRWDKYEGRMRLKLCSHILQTLQHICIIKSGRRTLATKKHIQILHRFCTGCPDDESFDRLVGKVCSIICLCLNNKALPVIATSPAVFNLSNIASEEWKVLDEPDADDNDDFSGSSSEEENAIEEDNCLLKQECDSLGSESESLLGENIDDEFKQSDETMAKLNSNYIYQSNFRDLEDLKRYNSFFKEFSGLQKQLRLIKNRSNSKCCLLDGSSSNMSSSDFNINRTEHSNLLKASFVNSSPSLLCDSENQIHQPMQLCCDIKYKKESENNLYNLKILRDLVPMSSPEQVYSIVGSRVRSIIPFVKVAYPDLHGGEALNKLEYLNELERSTCRRKLITCVDRAINPENLMNETVYDLDTIYSEDSSKSGDRILGNADVQKLACRQYQFKKLDFESRFESGNLRKVVQTGPREYDLILMPDVNSNKRHLWFYFEVSNMSNNWSYVFNIVNCEKSDSQFNFGMKPVMYSVKEATLGRPGWIRAGSDICYYRNSYQCAKSKNPSKCYLTVTFTIDFPHSNDVCYLAYHYPYTYSQMMSKIWILSQNLPPSIYFRMETLCLSLNSNEIPVLTITAEDSVTNPIQDREIIFLTSRVHPGESNASWVMDGTLSSLLNSTSVYDNLRATYVFKIIPMLNVEGVINGCYRCGLTNEDLNRRWSKPSPMLHPDIYHTKGLLEYMSRGLRRPATVYCDFHGHSRKKNVFLYGCAPAESWCPRDREAATPDDRLQYLALPALMERLCSAFSLRSCNFQIERERESTARVTVWRQLSVPRSYTLEASFCGFDQGPYKGLQLNTQHLQEVGSDFCAALAALKDAAHLDLRTFTDHDGNSVYITDSECDLGED